MLCPLGHCHSNWMAWEAVTVTSFGFQVLFLLFLVSFCAFHRNPLRGLAVPAPLLRRAWAAAGAGGSSLHCVCSVETREVGKSGPASSLFLCHF